MDQVLTYPGGSEWRRCDLHLHTPFSTLEHGFGSDFEAYASAVFNKAVASEIAVIGVTDYFTIHGYKELRALQADSARLELLLGGRPFRFYNPPRRSMALASTATSTALTASRPGSCSAQSRPGDFFRSWYPYMVSTGRFRAESPPQKRRNPLCERVSVL